ncbi:tRNA (cytosine(38)-C(5))-methyltransferase-like [Diadema antillarum]|uniref:tRNA (cytosine(38)-C(5))-methyltransferase-like n=1 Tax=Diadema antillarum TaxID=105358 RepID=UPI003A87519A
MAAPCESGAPLRVVEFFSGVGGLHCAVKESGIASIVVAAVEINTVANAVYRHNFPEVNLLQRNLEGFTTDDFDSFDADMIVMSPPCQPFTRVGLKGDKNDARTNAFFNIMRNLPKMRKKPRYILVENVKGFETSETRNFLAETLEKCQYTFQEFLLSPLDIGIPNQRLRYFLLAKQRPLSFNPEQGLELLPHRINQTSAPSSVQPCDLANEVSSLAVDSPSTVSSKSQSNAEESVTVSNVSPTSAADCNAASASERTEPICHMTAKDQTSNSHEQKLECDVESLQEQNRDAHNSKSATRTGNAKGGKAKRKIASYLQSDLTEDSVAQYLIPDRILLKFGKVMDIVTPEDTKTCCFTKAYAHYVEGTGSVLWTDFSTEMSEAFSEEDLPEEERMTRLRSLNLRYFTPREMANLHHFPQDFGFPETTTKKQLYRLIGNSLNVTLVAELIKYLVT